MFGAQVDVLPTPWTHTPFPLGGGVRPVASLVPGTAVVGLFLVAFVPPTPPVRVPGAMGVRLSLRPLRYL